MLKPLILAALIAFSADTQAQQLSPTEQAQVAAIANRVLASTGVPSASIGILRGGEIVYTQAFGFADVAAHKPATAAMAYPIGSVSKQFTATAVLRLQEQGKLLIDDPVAKYFPNLTRANEVTLRNLLTMTSGYSDFAPQDYSIPAWYQPHRPIQTIEEWATKPLDYAPGADNQYSNTNYVLLSLIVEKVTGEPLAQTLQRLVFHPAGLDKTPDTAVFNAYAHRERLQVLGYQSIALQAPRVLPLEGEGWYFGDGELAMPVATLLNWDKTFINQTVLTPASYALMEAPFHLTSGPNSGKDIHYGMGLHVQDRNGHFELEHSGEVGGYVSENVVYPQDKLAICVLTNEVASDAASEIAYELRGLLLPGATTPPKAAEPADPLTALLPTILTSLAHGTFDSAGTRALFTSNASAYFSPEAVHDFQALLAPLGPVATVTRTATNHRGGMLFGFYKVTFSNNPTVLTLDTYTLPDGKIEQLLILGRS